MSGGKTAKDMVGQRIMMKLAKPRRPSKDNPDKWWTRETKLEDFDKLDSYCDTDVRGLQYIMGRFGRLPDREQQIYQHNFELSIRGVPVDPKLARRVLKLKDIHIANITDQLTKLTDGRITSATQHARFAQELNMTSVSRENLEAVDLSKVDPYSRQLIKLRLAAGRTSTAKFEKLLDQEIDGVVHGQLIVNAANTGRYAGSGLQIHNMFRNDMKEDEINKVIALIMSDFKPRQVYKKLLDSYPDIMKLFSNLIRPAIKAPKGKRFVPVDYAAVEARLVAWLADDKYMLNVFKEFDEGHGEEPYCVMARDIFHRTITKADEVERFIGKQTVLGCGFGMSSYKFRMTCQSYGVEISQSLADKAVKTFRERATAIKKAWQRMNDAIVFVIQNNVKRRCCRCDWEMVYEPVRALRVTLPTGKQLHFVNPSTRVVPHPMAPDWLVENIYYDGIGENHQWTRIKTYGASMLETITQGMAAELLKETLLRAAKKRMPIVFHVHDEPVAMVSEQKAEKALRVLTYIMENSRQCDAPIKAEGAILKRYRKT
jgi:DNA polymerase